MDAVAATPVPVRIREFRTVPVERIGPHPLQWREHPESQVAALREMLATIGVANVVVLYESPTRNVGRFTAIDGHMRTGESGVTEWPAVILDVTDEEADLLLATLDPISALASANAERIRELHDRIALDSGAVMRMLADVRARHGAVDVSGVEFKEYDESVADEVQYHECPACGHRWPQ